MTTIPRMVTIHCDGHHYYSMVTLPSMVAIHRMLTFSMKVTIPRMIPIPKTYLALFVPSWPHFCPILLRLSLFDPVWLRLGPFCPLCPVWPRLGPFGPVWPCLTPFGFIVPCLVNMHRTLTFSMKVTIPRIITIPRTYLALFVPICPHFCPILLRLVPFGPVHT